MEHGKVKAWLDTKGTGSSRWTAAGRNCSVIAATWRGQLIDPAAGRSGCRATWKRHRAAYGRDRCSSTRTVCVVGGPCPAHVRGGRRGGAHGATHPLTHLPHVEKAVQG